MNYLKLKSLIIGVTVVALLVSFAALAVGLVLPVGKLDLQGASGLASIIPAFAGVLIAAFALYSYNKLEDADYARARQLVAARDELTSQLRLAAYSVATAVRFESEVAKMHERRMLAEHGETGKFRSPDGQEYSSEKQELAQKVIGSHAAGVGRLSSQIHLKATLQHLEGKIVESMTLLTPLILQRFRGDESKTKAWLTSLQGIIFGCSAFDQQDQRLIGLANIVRGSKVVASLLGDPFFSSIPQIYKALTENGGGSDVPPSIIAIIEDLDSQFARMAKDCDSPAMFS